MYLRQSPTSAMCSLVRFDDYFSGSDMFLVTLFCASYRYSSYSHCIIRQITMINLRCGNYFLKKTVSLTS